MIIERRKCEAEEQLHEEAAMKISAISIPAMTRIARRLIRIWNSPLCMELRSLARAFALFRFLSLSFFLSLSLSFALA